MTSNIIKRAALALCLGIAPASLAFAQTERPLVRPPVEGEPAIEGEGGATLEGEAGAQVEGEAGATVEGEAGATVEGEAGATAEGEAEPLVEGEAGTAEAPADEEQPDAAAEGEAAPAEEEAADAPADEEETGTTAESEAAGEAETEAAAGADVDLEITGSIDVDEEQRTQIAEVVRDIDIEPVDVDFEINVGTAIPTTSAVALHIVPDDIVSVVPEFRGHLHFVAADRRIVIVDPCSLQIVSIIA